MKEIVPEDFTHQIPVIGDISKTAIVKAERGLSLSLLEGEEVSVITEGKRFEYWETAKGQEYGSLIVYLDGKEIDRIGLIYEEDIKAEEIKRNFFENIWEMLKNFRR